MPSEPTTMNKIIFSGLVFFLISFQPSAGKSSTENYDTQFSFKVEGEVIGGEGLVLALVIPSQSEDRRINCKIINGRFTFEGKLAHDALARIMFEEDILDYTGAYSFFPLVLSEGITKVKYKIKKENGEPLRYSIENLEIVSGDIAKEFKYFQDRISATVFKGLRFYSNPILIDSVNKNILPLKRKAFELLYVQIRDSIKSSYTKMKLLEYVAFSPLYEKNDYLSSDDKSFIVKQFKDLESQIKGFGEYEFVATKFYKSFESPALDFSDYELADINGGTRKLSKIISENNFTVLYFWWTHCLPCRSFNQSQSEYYSKLKKEKIEFVSINTDNSRTKWQNSSKADSIPWINLYAGDTSPILPLYRVNSYPTKIIIDKNFKIVDFGFKSMDDLHKLVK